MIAVSGRLNTQQYGRGVLPPLPAELTKTLLRNQWKVTPDKAQHVRRSIYVFARRNLRYPIFDVFDRPDANASCAARSKSTTAPQSLLLFNSEFSLETARHLAGRLMVEKGEKRIETAVALAWGRKPSVAEVELLTKFVDRQAGDLEADGRDVRTMALPLPPTEGEPFRQAALVDLCLALINANEFIYYD